MSVKLRFIRLIMRKFNPSGTGSLPDFTKTESTTTSTDFGDFGNFDSNENGENELDVRVNDDSSSVTLPPRDSSTKTSTPGTKSPTTTIKTSTPPIQTIDLGDSLQFSDDVF